MELASEVEDVEVAVARGEEPPAGSDLKDPETNLRLVAGYLALLDGEGFGA
ncbi:MAG TPA: hypothetical protein VFI25_18300 [Planctomycetota bacterium]|nr:hypothetical protein [Planctomycetota bacterium]